MRRVALGHKRAAELNMTPMIDGVFLLIIFFLVSSHLARREALVEVALPAAATGAATRDDAPRVTVNVAADGSLSVGATRVTLAQLVEKLVAELDQHDERLRVRVRSDRAAPYAAIEPALAACAEVGIEDIGLAVLPQPQPGAAP